MTTEPETDTYALQLTGSEIRHIFHALTCQLLELEQKATRYQARTTTHARNSLRSTRREINHVTRIRESLRPTYDAAVASLLASLETTKRANIRALKASAGMPADASEFLQDHVQVINVTLPTRKDRD